MKNLEEAKSFLMDVSKREGEYISMELHCYHNGRIVLSVATAGKYSKDAIDDISDYFGVKLELKKKTYVGEEGVLKAVGENEDTSVTFFNAVECKQVGTKKKLVKYKKEVKEAEYEEVVEEMEVPVYKCPGGEEVDW